MHVPPFEHRSPPKAFPWECRYSAASQKSWLEPHVSPLNPVGHAHLNALMSMEGSELESLHVPPFVQGFEAHSSKSVLQVGPDQPGTQWQEKGWLVSCSSATQVAPC